MQALALALLFVAADPVNIQLEWKGGDPTSTSPLAAEVSQDATAGSGDMTSDSPEPVSLRAAIAAYRKAGGQRAYVRGMTDYQHLVRDHKWSDAQLKGLTFDELQYLHGASHAGKLTPDAFRAPADATPATAPPAAPAADKPSITITVADFYCAPCNQLKAMDWKDFNVTWAVGGAPAYPQISWQDARGVTRVLTGAYTPSRVMWSWKATQ